MNNQKLFGMNEDNEYSKILIKKRSKDSRSEKLKQYNITYSMIADWFNYTTHQSFISSSIRSEMLRGVENVIEHVEQQLGAIG